jgi:hypothetical protein
MIRSSSNAWMIIRLAPPRVANAIASQRDAGGWPILAGLGYARVGLSRRVSHFEFRISNFDLRDCFSSFDFSTHYPLFTTHCFLTMEDQNRGAATPSHQMSACTNSSPWLPAPR